MKTKLVVACALAASGISFTALAANTTTTSTVKTTNTTSPAVAATPGASGQQVDVNLMTQIRDRLTKDQTLSVQAKNVQIVAQDGHVTLSGTVPSQAEASAIEGIALKVAGNGRVVNQLNVVQ